MRRSLGIAATVIAAIVALAPAAQAAGEGRWIEIDEHYNVADCDVHAEALGRFVYDDAKYVVFYAQMSGDCGEGSTNIQGYGPRGRQLGGGTNYIETSTTGTVSMTVPRFRGLSVAVQIDMLSEVRSLHWHAPMPWQRAP